MTLPIKLQANKRQAFTLLELMLVIVLVAMTLGTLALSIPKLLAKEKFFAGVKAVEAKILLAEEVLFDYHADLTLRFKKKDSGYECLFCSCRLPEKLLTKLNKDAFIPNIDKITFQGKDDLVLSFSTSISPCPKGTLQITGYETTSLFLPGYPGKIFKQTPQGHEATVPYPKELLSAH